MYQLTWVTWKAYLEVVHIMLTLKKKMLPAFVEVPKWKCSGQAHTSHLIVPILSHRIIRKCLGDSPPFPHFLCREAWDQQLSPFVHFVLFMSGICFDLVEFIFLNRKKYISWGRIQGHLQPREAASWDPSMAKFTLQSHYQHLHLRFKS